MSAWSRAPADVRWAVTGLRAAMDDADRRHIRDARPITRAQQIADFQQGSATAASIIRDIHDCRANRHSDPLRWAIDLMREDDKRSMLAAQIKELRRLLRDLGAYAGRAVMS
jgi:hypothetical protein